MNHEIIFTIERNGEKKAIEIELYIEPYIQGKYFGPPELCYPDEGGYATIEVVKWDGELTDDEIARIEEAGYKDWEMRNSVDWKDND